MSGWVPHATRGEGEEELEHRHPESVPLHRGLKQQKLRNDGFQGVLPLLGAHIESFDDAIGIVGEGREEPCDGHVDMGLGKHLGLKREKSPTMDILVKDLSMRHAYES